MGSLSRRDSRRRRTLSRRSSLSRRQRSISRLVADVLLAAAMSLALIMSPWVPSLLPAPLDDIGTEPAGAQQSQTPTLTVTDKRASCPVDPAITPSTADDHLLVLCITPRICPGDAQESVDGMDGSPIADEVEAAEVVRINTLCIEPAECNHANGLTDMYDNDALAKSLLERLGYLEARIDSHGARFVFSNDLRDHSDLYVFCVAADSPGSRTCSGDDGSSVPPHLPVDSVTFSEGVGNARWTLRLHVVCVPANACARLPPEAQVVNPNHRNMLIYCLAVNPCALDRGGDSEAEEVLNRRMPGDPPKNIICGTPSPCPPEPWQIGQDPSLCELTLQACPPSPLKLPPPGPSEQEESGQESEESVSGVEESGPETIRYMRYSTEYVDLCEDTVDIDDSLNDPNFGEENAAEIHRRCALRKDDEDALKGFAYEADGQQCRIFVPARCAPGLHRANLRMCTQYERRTWTCLQEAGYIQRNEFNTCYLERDESESTISGGSGPCGAGAPQFAISDCEAYVGEDYVRSPSAVQCADYDTGSIGSTMRISDHTNNYWCVYERRWLDTDCHSELCDAEPAVCIKRESSTGGCDAIAHTVRCRVIQAGFRDPSRGLSADDSYGQGCSPCQVLPFEPASSTCETSISDEPATYNTASTSALSSVDRNRIESIFRVKNDFAHSGHCTDVVEGGDFEVGSECDKMTVCVDPPRGRIEANISHAAGIAMVNSTVIIHLLDVPLTTARRHWFEYSSYFTHRSGTATFHESFRLKHDDRFVYTDSSGASVVLKMQPESPPDNKFDDLEDLLRTTGGSCTLKIRPAFRLIAEPLWPDEDAAEITRLFGPDSLDWWDPLTDEQKLAHSRAHGFVFLDSFDGEPDEEEAKRNESERRDQEMQEIIDCNYGDDVWCRWTPEQTGYYRLFIAGAWPVVKHGTASHWRDNPLGSTAPCRAPIVLPFPDPLPSADARGLCSLALLQYRLRNTAGDDLDYGLEQMGISDPRDIGINVAEMGDSWDWANAIVISPPSDNLDLYRDGVSDAVTCPAQDVRVRCGGGSASNNYTETEPLGIIVYQSRVVTRQGD